jgi:hypothetical protein
VSGVANDPAKISLVSLTPVEPVRTTDRTAEVTVAPAGIPDRSNTSSVCAM